MDAIRPQDSNPGSAVGRGATPVLGCGATLRYGRVPTPGLGWGATLGATPGMGCGATLGAPPGMGCGGTCCAIELEPRIDMKRNATIRAFLRMSSSTHDRTGSGSR